jgi:hypothetical protein
VVAQANPTPASFARARTYARVHTRPIERVRADPYARERAIAFANRSGPAILSTVALGQNDAAGESPVDWEDVPMGPGQDPPRPNAVFQFSRQLGLGQFPIDFRREPDHTSFVVVSRWPERPA